MKKIRQLCGGPYKTESVCIGGESKDQILEDGRQIESCAIVTNILGATTTTDGSLDAEQSRKQTR